jgi:hypothetical protein
MRRNGLITIAVLTGSAMLAQGQSNGGWRRATEPPPSAPEAQDPSQPVERTPVDEYGNPRQQPNDRPQGGGQSSYGLPPQLIIKPGTFITVRVNQALNSDRNQPGDIFTATLAQPVVVDGIVVAQRGQTVMGRVAEAKKAGRVEGTSRLGLQLTAITLADGNQANVQSALVNRNGRSDAGRDVATVATTTGVGAAIGAAADWGRGAAIGAGAGAAAGLIGVLLTRGHPTIVYPETVLTFQLGAAVTVNTTRAPYAYRYVGPEDYNHQTEARMMRPAPGPGPGPGPYYYGPYPYYPYYGYPYYGGFGFGVVVRGGGYWRRWR